MAVEKHRTPNGSKRPATPAERIEKAAQRYANFSAGINANVKSLEELEKAMDELLRRNARPLVG